VGGFPKLKVGADNSPRPEYDFDDFLLRQQTEFPAQALLEVAISLGQRTEFFIRSEIIGRPVEPPPAAALIQSDLREPAGAVIVQVPGDLRL
jgi:hypothetical protein